MTRRQSYTDKLTELIGYTVSVHMTKNAGGIVTGVLNEVGEDYLLLKCELMDDIEDRLITYVNIKMVQFNEDKERILKQLDNVYSS